MHKFELISFFSGVARILERAGLKSIEQGQKALNSLKFYLKKRSSLFISSKHAHVDGPAHISIE